MSWTKSSAHGRCCKIQPTSSNRLPRTRTRALIDASSISTTHAAMTLHQMPLGTGDEAELKAFLTIVRRKIYALQPGQSLILPGGWVTGPAGGETKKKKDKQVGFTHRETARSLAPFFLFTMHFPPQDADTTQPRPDAPGHAMLYIITRRKDKPDQCSFTICNTGDGLEYVQNRSTPRLSGCSVSD